LAPIINQNESESIMTKEDLGTTIKTTDDDRRVFVDKYDDGVVWLSVSVSGGGANCTLTFDQAKAMIKAINTVMGEVKA